MKKKFTNWYANQITQAMDKGQEPEQIEIPLKLSIVKQLHAKWLIEMYNEMTSAAGKQVCLKGWQVAGIKDAVTQSLSSLASLDPFTDINPMFEAESNVQIINPSGLSAASKYVCEYERRSEAKTKVTKKNGLKKIEIFLTFLDG